jgi:hypothetical protein
MYIHRFTRLLCAISTAVRMVMNMTSNKIKKNDIVSTSGKNEPFEAVPGKLRRTEGSQDAG